MANIQIQISDRTLQQLEDAGIHVEQITEITEKALRKHLTESTANFTEIERYSRNYFVCNRCGALVEEREPHDDFHNRLNDWTNNG